MSWRREAGKPQRKWNNHRAPITFSDHLTLSFPAAKMHPSRTFFVRQRAINKSPNGFKSTKNTDRALISHSHIFHINFKVHVLTKSGTQKKNCTSAPPAPSPHLSFKGGGIKTRMDGIIAWLQSAGYWAAFTVAMQWGGFSSYKGRGRFVSFLLWCKSHSLKASNDPS